MRRGTVGELANGAAVRLVRGTAGTAGAGRAAGGAPRDSVVEGATMSSPRRVGHRVLAIMAALSAALAIASVSAPASAQDGTPTLEWFGWSHFRLTSVAGKVIFINPFTTNPDTTVSVDDITKADLILAADAHGDELGSTLAIAQKTGAMTFVAGGGLNGWLLEQGLPQAQVAQRFAQPGNVHRTDGVRIIMLNSVHGSELAQPTAANPYGGTAGSYMITLENGYTVYFQGSSAATADMALWAEMYKPDAMIFHMSGQHDPLDVAMSIRLMTTSNPNLKLIMPHHHRVQVPAGQTTVSDVQAAMAQLGVPPIPITEQVRSQIYQLTK
jgi:L-ascorbate metabolism protein UlaG (beta-lactamase superfamily)